MGYRDDFYTVQNIIGYTGDLNGDPTVYFQSGNEVGRITQKHDYSQNVGRGRVKNDPTYQFANVVQPDGSIKMVEMSQGRVKHTSRNAFMPVAQMTSAQLDILAQAIWKYQDEKYISGFSRTTRAAISRTKASKARMHQQLFAAVAARNQG